MNFVFSTAADNNGHKSGIIKEGSINELGEVSYTKNQQFDDDHYPSFEEIVANEVLKRIYGSAPQLSRKTAEKEALDHARESYGIKEKKKEPIKVDPSAQIKIGVDVKSLNDDEFIEFTKRRVQSNKDHDRFKTIKAKIRSTLEGRSYNEKAFNLFVKLHEIDKKGFFNRTPEDDAVISEAIKLYGSA
jgi:hypothetical protein